MRLPAIIATLVVSTAICGCAGLGRMRDTVARFDQGVHSASTAQIGYFQAIRAADCNQQFYKSAFDFATAPRDANGQYPQVKFVAAGGPCVPLEMSDEQLAVRSKLMQLIVLYGDAIQTLANGTDNKDLSENSKSLLRKIKDLAEQQKITVSPDAGIAAAALDTAVVTITEMIFDHTKYKDIKSAAASVSRELHVVVDALKAENNADMNGLASKADALSADYQSALLAAREHLGAAAFIDAVEVRITFQQIVISPANVEQLNATLDALVAANDALARASEGGAIPEIADLISRAQQASTLFNSLK